MANNKKNIAEFSSTDLKTINDIIRNLGKTEREEIFKKKCKNTQYHDGIISKVATKNGSVFELKSVEEIETRYQEVLNDSRNKEKNDQKSAEGNYFPSSSIASYKDIIIKYAIAKSIEDKLKGISLTRQTIYYGSPGCGKSRKVKDILENIKEDYKFRTTFHPDCDYYNFVGAYKPRKDNNGSITYDFSPQVFTKAYIKAWINQCEPIFLIIEEINRGNCAQIFGDLFQLLDRDGDGYSEYPIKADEDLMSYVKTNCKNPAAYSNDELRLPPNLYIVATMNTSDQSLFPMDSAFKRRWAWKYVPIDYTNAVSGSFKIKIGGKDRGWHDFLKKINAKIYKVTNSEDKMLGNFFIKSSIDEEDFVDKVMFYLWNDVLKLEYASGNDYFFKKEDDSKFKFSDLYDSNTRTSTLESFMKYLGL